MLLAKSELVKNFFAARNKIRHTEIKVQFIILLVAYLIRV